jgi:hypothetical protein
VIQFYALIKIILITVRVTSQSIGLKKRPVSPKKRNQNIIKQSSKLLSPKLEKFFEDNELKKYVITKIKTMKKHPQMNPTNTLYSRKSVSKKNVAFNSIKKS